MAACGSLHHIFEKPLPENTNLFDSLSPWKRISSVKSSSTHLDDSPSSSFPSSSFTEIFGELRFKETPSSPSSLSSSASSSVLTDVSSQVSAIIGKNDKNGPTTNIDFVPTNKTRQYRHSDSFSSMNSESLSMCTEGLGFESFDDVEDSKSDVDNPSTHWRPHHHHRRERRTSCIKHTQTEYLSSGESKRSRISGVEFPPPISCIVRSGKPWVCFKSYRTNGRFILKEVRIPTQEFLHACREDGRLKLQFIQSDDEKIDEDEEEEESVDLNLSNDEDDNDGGHDDNPDEKEENDAEEAEKKRRFILGRGS